MAAFPATGCGALIFPERQHEPHSKKLDPNIVILDGIGLLFFILPGLVAFGIDFYTGAIYLPPDVTKGEGPFIEDPDAPPDPEEAEQDAAFETRPEE